MFVTLIGYDSLTVSSSGHYPKSFTSLDLSLVSQGGGGWVRRSQPCVQGHINNKLAVQDRGILAKYHHFCVRMTATGDQKIRTASDSDQTKYQGSHPAASQEAHPAAKAIAGFFLMVS